MNYKKPIPIQLFQLRNEYCTLISRLTGVPVDDIMGAGRRGDIVTARFLLMWALIVLLKISPADTGILLRKNYSTCIYGKRVIDGAKQLPPKIEAIKNQLKKYYNEQKI